MKIGRYESSEKSSVGTAITFLMIGVGAEPWSRCSLRLKPASNCARIYVAATTMLARLCRIGRKTPRTTCRTRSSAPPSGQRNYATQLVPKAPQSRKHSAGIEIQVLSRVLRFPAFVAVRRGKGFCIFTPLPTDSRPTLHRPRSALRRYCSKPASASSAWLGRAPAERIALDAASRAR